MNSDSLKDNSIFAGRTRRPTRLGQFDFPRYPFARSPDQDAGEIRRHPVIIVGGGMVGLTLAIDLGSKGIATVLLDDNDTVSSGSRSIAQARRTMEIWSRLGVAEPMRRKGISWSRGNTHYQGSTVLSFDVFPEGNSRFPSFTSLAQYYVEHYLVERAHRFPNVDLRWLNRVVGVTQSADGVQLEVETPEGAYSVRADWVVAADGARSSVRSALGLPFGGDKLHDKFVIADVRLDADYPFERNFWFDPLFYEGNTVLRVPQSDSIWRVDWQIDPDADATVELAPDMVDRRLRRIFGNDADFTVEWVSTYNSQHRLMDSFRSGRVFFAGDAAHQFSPFGGGRGGNSGVQDADNLGWKLAAVVAGRADAALLDSYDAERRPIAMRNIADSSLSTEFITPKSAHSLALHDAVLGLATVVPFAKAFINTGRFAVWPVLEHSTISAPDDPGFGPQGRPGTPAFDCALEAADGSRVWFGDRIGNDFVLVLYGAAEDISPALGERLDALFATRVVTIRPAGASGSDKDLVDAEGSFASLYDARPGTAYLFRPDQHVLGRWRRLDADVVVASLKRALGADTRSHAKTGNGGNRP